MSTKYLRKFSQPKKVSRYHQIKFKLFLLGILILGITFLTWYLPRKEILTDREITFIGPDTLIDLVKIKINDFISRDYFFHKNNLFINSVSLSNYLTDNFLEIDFVDIKKDFLKKKLTVKISERQGIGIFCSSSTTKESSKPASTETTETQENRPDSVSKQSLDKQSGSSISNKITDFDDCYWFDKEAFLFKQAPELTGSLVLRIIDKRGGDFKLGGQPLNKKTVTVLIDFKNLIKKYLDFEISNFLITSEFYPDLIARTTSGFDIYFESEDYGEALTKFKEIINKKTPDINLEKIKYFDLRTKNRIYYK